jgi:hypothetical protein
MKEIKHLNRKDAFLAEEFSWESYLTEADYFSKIFFEIDSDWLMDNWDRLTKFGDVNENPQDPLQYVLTAKNSRDEKKALKLLPKIAVKDIHRL